MRREGEVEGWFGKGLEGGLPYVSLVLWTGESTVFLLRRRVVRFKVRKDGSTPTIGGEWDHGILYLKGPQSSCSMCRWGSCVTAKALCWVARRPETGTQVS